VKRAAIAALLVAFGCGYTVPTPKTGPHTRGEPVAVPYPPPPAKPEVIPKPPKGMESSSVWVDGSWDWRGHRWTWTPGKWESPLPDTYYAVPTTVRMSDGTLGYFPGAWRSTLMDEMRAAGAASSAAPAAGPAPTSEKLDAPPAPSSEPDDAPPSQATDKPR
jgi:hypothetical protein